MLFRSVAGCGGTVDYLVDAVFNYPTLAESYKIAALDATNKMREISRLSSHPLSFRSWPDHRAIS